MRRDFLVSAQAGLATAALLQSGDVRAEPVPWSAGEERPRLQAPPNATDAHHHIYDSRFPVDPKAVLRPADATVADYRLLQKSLGTTRHVIVQPSTYGVDNRCLLDALGQFGLATARGIAVVNTGVSDAELKQLQAAGVRGIRFNLAPPGATTVDMVDPLSKRVNELGWHIQLNMRAADILANKDLWNRVPCPIVFDHLAHVREPEGVNDPVFALVVDLLHRDKAWVKLSGAYIETRVGAPTYADSTAVAQAYVREAPERLVWGTDWPHPTEKIKPDDAVLFDLLGVWAPDEATRTRILVDNPTRLYGFS
ncbi:MAG: amidohydrolase family protein [Acetobacteraceae bacterium]|nr:amidohydrolase family protein [Acetobacteraceae bacterium]